MDLKLEDATVYKQLKKFFQTISSDQLAMVINHLNTLYERKRKKEEAITEKTRKRQEALDQIKHLMSAAQISLTDVKTGVVRPKKSTVIRPRRPAPPKYRWQDNEGNTCEWSGRGRTPLSLAALLDQGAKLDDFLIKKQEQK